MFAFWVLEVVPKLGPEVALKIMPRFSSLQSCSCWVGGLVDEVELAHPDNKNTNDNTANFFIILLLFIF